MITIIVLLPGSLRGRLGSYIEARIVGIVTRYIISCKVLNIQ